MSSGPAEEPAREDDPPAPDEGTVATAAAQPVEAAPREAEVGPADAASEHDQRTAAFVGAP